MPCFLLVRLMDFVMKLQPVLLVAVLATFGIANAEFVKYQQSVVAIYQPYVIIMPPPTPAVPISLFVERPTDNQHAEILKAINLTNALRAKNGLSVLRYDENLSAYAQLRAYEIVQKFDHERPNGEMYYASMRVGKGSNENIAAGKARASDVILQFKNSPTHYHALMSANHTKIGMGLVYAPKSQYKYYWVQILGADDTRSPAMFKK